MEGIMRKNLRYYLFFLFLAVTVLAINSTVQAGAQGKKVLMIIAHRDFQDKEFKIPRKTFEKDGLQVSVSSSKTGEARGSSGTRVEPDVLIDDVNVADYDAVVFVGGLGVKKDYWNNAKAHAIARDAVAQGKVLAAICWAPVILANAGVLEGKQATVSKYMNAHRILKTKGCTYTGKKVTADGNIITADGPDAAKSFAKAIIEALQ
jgi:protease I